MSLTKKYTRLDVVDAMPMTFGGFSEFGYLGEFEGKFPPGTKGYLIKRAGALDEWMPADDFEKQFTNTDDHIGRMKFERNELKGRLDKLCNYLNTHSDDTLLAI